MTICKEKKLLLGNYKISYIKLKTNLDRELSGGKNKILNVKHFMHQKGVRSLDLLDLPLMKYIH